MTVRRSYDVDLRKQIYTYIANYSGRAKYHSVQGDAMTTIDFDRCVPYLTS